MLLSLSRPASAQDATAPPAPPSFDDFLAGVRADALSRGVSVATLDDALGSLQPDPAVVARDRDQPELTQTLDAYVAKRLTATLIATGRDTLAANQDLLTRVTAAYGVPANIMVALWGMESNYGRTTGSYGTIRSLATLAFDARRPLFRPELLAALEILDRGQMPASELKGSWAGAMGQPQFMPSSFLRHAVDFDGDGHIDIWTSAADVLGSMANFLQAAGWGRSGTWGAEVKVSTKAMARIAKTVPLRTTGCRALREMTVVRPLSEWKKLGVTPRRKLPGATAASLVRGEHRNFLVYKNYEAVLDYNCSNAYAVTIGLLADNIGAR